MKTAKSTNGVSVRSIFDQYIYATSKSWVFGLDDDKQRQFGIMFEVMDARDFSEEDVSDYPYMVSASIVANKPHKSFYEGEGVADKDGLLIDMLGYMGGVPVDHTLTHAIKNGGEAAELTAFEALASQFTVHQATVKTVKSDYGTIAAQNGPGSTHSYMMFKTENDAKRFVDLLIGRAGCMGMMIGFILDRPINMMGETGWSVINKQVFGAKSKRGA